MLTSIKYYTERSNKMESLFRDYGMTKEEVQNIIKDVKANIDDADLFYRMLDLEHLVDRLLYNYEK